MTKVLLVRQNYCEQKRITCGLFTAIFNHQYFRTSAFMSNAYYNVQYLLVFGIGLFSIFYAVRFKEVGS